ncbi:citron Rho-interacting kinase-like [Hylaeus volcanicus]|uniref:citron Rho-interacting kinase-like n=1 Tax=Hylaeus volcanicus TaxID=313075 RepID=UPI0023B81AB8|nr:citron Rho-interacting kinase-like [Hylaeus volcanicus]
MRQTPGNLGSTERILPSWGIIGDSRPLSRTERTAVAQDQDGGSINAQEARLTAIQKVDTERKTTFTQTSSTVLPPSKKFLPVDDQPTNINAYFERKKSSTFRSVEEDPAPQWLIEEALNRMTEHSERWTKTEALSSKETEYKATIADLEAQLTRTKEELSEALRMKSVTKEKYKRSLASVKAEARRENESLQDRIIRICTSVLENFGPRTLSEKRGNSYRFKCRTHLKSHKKISSKLHKKLRKAVARSSKLKWELTKVRRALENKTKKCETISKCFDKLKEDMDVAEGNLNKLISENLALRKSMEDTREWMERNMGKEHHEKTNAAHFRDMQRSRELTNLKKKSEEDFNTIAQLRNKLLRSESANANKGFLLNSYKSQLSDLNKEKNQLLSKISTLENEITAAKTSSSQLKAKISVLNNEKDKLLSDNEKSKTDVAEKKCEETMQQETNLMKARYEETIKSIKMKMMTAEDRNMEYSKAIRDFLKKIYDYRGGPDTQRSLKEDEASEKQAHETACNILNMSPEELSGFINGKTFNSINSWVFELNRILGKNNFSESLSKFLFRKTLKKMKT